MRRFENFKIIEKECVKKKKGISLIVLVITIIIMIILVATVIISLNGSNIIERADSAVAKTNLSEIQNLASIAWAEAYADGKITQPELETAVMNSLKANGVSEDKLSDYLIKVTTDGVSVKEKMLNETSVPEEWAENITKVIDTVPIPKGFIASSATGEKTKADGLVIYEGDELVTDKNVETAKRNRNQYVWVPVEDFTKFVRKDYINDTSVIVNTLGTTSKYWEVILNITTNMPASEQNDAYVSSTTLTEVQEMYESVKEYGGFYIARYEAGLEKARTSLDDEITKGTAVYSMMGKKPYGYIIWGNSLKDDTNGAVEVARSIYTKTNDNHSVVSTLTYGVQWDAVLEWWLNTGVMTQASVSEDSKDYGNYLDHKIQSALELNEGSEYARVTVIDSSNYVGTYAEVTTDYNKSQSIHLLTTWALKAAKINNIYDMAGNAGEWTMEGRSTYGHVFRGGNCVRLSNDTPLSSRNGIGVASSDEIGGVHGFRVALYIKL